MRVHQPSCYLREILKDVRNGRLAPAGMQRGYVWSCDDIEKLMDSVQDGLPMGAIVTWMPTHDTRIDEMAKGRLGPIEAVAGGDVRELIIDGQNRLATFAWLESHIAPDDASPAEEAAWLSGRALYLDAESGRIRFMDPETAETRLCIGGAAVLNSILGNQEIRRLWDGWLAMGYAEKEIEAFVDMIDQTQRHFADAKIVKTVIENATPEEAQSIFLRICKTGVPMSVEDFFQASHWQPASAAAPK